MNNEGTLVVVNIGLMKEIIFLKSGVQWQWKYIGSCCLTDTKLVVLGYNYYEYDDFVASFVLMLIRGCLTDPEFVVL